MDFGATSPTVSYFWNEKNNFTCQRCVLCCYLCASYEPSQENRNFITHHTDLRQPDGGNHEHGSIRDLIQHWNYGYQHQQHYC